MVRWGILDVELVVDVLPGGAYRAFTCLPPNHFVEVSVGQDHVLVNLALR